MELIDDVIKDQFPMAEALRCIQMGLLCVQQQPDNRPTMSVVLQMLDNVIAMSLQPKRLGFYTERCLTKTDSSSNRKRSSTEKDLTTAVLEVDRSLHIPKSVSIEKVIIPVVLWSMACIHFASKSYGTNSGKLYNTSKF